MNEIWTLFRKLNFLVGSHHFQGLKYLLKNCLGCMEADAGWNEMIWKKSIESTRPTTGYRGQNDLMAPWHKCRITDSPNFIPKSIFLISLNVNLGIFSGKCILNEKKKLTHYLTVFCWDFLLEKNSTKYGIMLLLSIFRYHKNEYPVSHILPYGVKRKTILRWRLSAENDALLFMRVMDKNDE